MSISFNTGARFCRMNRFSDVAFEADLGIRWMVHGYGVGQGGLPMA
jgi:hypothetical protein